MKKKIFCLILITFLIAFGHVTSVYALTIQGTQECITAVGTPAPGESSKIGCGSATSATGDSATGGVSTDTSGIVGWAQKINDVLTPGYDYGTGNAWYDKMVNNICNNGYCATISPSTGTDNLYWCTFTVVDAFNLAGKKGLTLDDLAVINMVAFWKVTSGYVYLDYYANNKAALQKVVPGDPFFMANDLTQTVNEEHTGIVKTISIDPTTGNGSITTLESNSTDKGHTFPVENWIVHNVFFTLQGFGGFN